MFTVPGFSNYIEGVNKLEDEVWCQPFNYRGVPEDVTMPRVYWAYLKWLDFRGHIDADQYISDMSHRFRGQRMQSYLACCVMELCHYRAKSGKERPHWAVAAVTLPDTWLDFCLKHSKHPKWDNPERQKRRDYIGGEEFF